MPTSRSIVWRVLAPMAAIALTAEAPAHARFTPGIVFRMNTSLINVYPPRVDTSDTPNIQDNADRDPNAPPPPPGAGGRGGGRGGGAAGGARGGGAPPGAGGPGGGRGGAGGGAQGMSNREVFSAQVIPGMGYIVPIGVGQAGGNTIYDAYIATDTVAYTLNTQTKTYTSNVQDIGSTVAMVQAMDRKEIVYKVKVTMDTLADSSVAGEPTHHYRMGLEYTIANGVDPTTGTTRQSSTQATSDFFVLPGAMHFNNPWVGFARPKDGYSPGLKVWVKKLEDSQDAINAAGLVVKYVATGKINIEDPHSGTYTRTMDITNITSKDIDPSIFQIPSDYKEGGGRGGRGGRGGGQ